MDLGQRLRVALGAVVLLVLGALAFAFLLTAFAVLLVVGAVLALAPYVRFRLFARRVRKALEQQGAHGNGNPGGGAGGGGAIDADFKVER